MSAPATTTPLSSPSSPSSPSSSSSSSLSPASSCPSLLPRSIRWRVQLGLFDVPSTSCVTEPTTTETAAAAAAAASAATETSDDELLSTSLLFTSSLSRQEELERLASHQKNRQQIWLQRSNYENLMKEYAQEFEAAYHLVQLSSAATTTATARRSAAGAADEYNNVEGGSGSNYSTVTVTSLDPLSIFALEAEAKGRRAALKRHNSPTSPSLSSNNKSIWNNLLLDDTDATSGSDDNNANENDEDDEQDIEEILATITKDLKRLQPEHSEFFVNCMIQNFQTLPNDAMEQRRAYLKELLYFFAREHPSLGYHQGMHELASLLLLVSELDVFQTKQTTSKRSTTTSTTTLPFSTPSTLLFLDEEYLLHDTFAMMESLFLKIGPAYAADSDNLDVTSKIRFVSGDDRLLRYLAAMDVAPELYCARWIRLLFSREVTHWTILLPLWDLFFDLASSQQQQPAILSMGRASSYTKPGLSPAFCPGGMDWVTVLETAAASLIWMHRKEFLTMEPDDGFCALVNMPPMDSVRRLMATILSTMRRLQYNQKPQRRGMVVPDEQKIPTRWNSARLLSLTQSIDSSEPGNSTTTWMSMRSLTQQSRSPRTSVSPVPRNSQSRSSMWTRSRSPGPPETTTRAQSQSPGPTPKIPTARRSWSRSPPPPQSTSLTPTRRRPTIQPSDSSDEATSNSNVFQTMSKSNIFKNAAAMLPSVPAIRSGSSLIER